MIRVHPQQDDDAGMIDLLERMAQRSAEACDVRDYFVVRLRGWFSAKQFEFSGVLSGRIRQWYRSHQTLPPFVPGRVLSQHSFERTADQLWREVEREPVHRKQPSNENLKRSMYKFLSRPTGFLWFGVDNNEPARFSLMCYLWTPEQVCNWYVSLAQQGEEWIDEQRVGIGQAEYQTLMHAAEPDFPISMSP